MRNLQARLPNCFASKWRCAAIGTMVKLDDGRIQLSWNRKSSLTEDIEETSFHGL